MWREERKDPGSSLLGGMEPRPWRGTMAVDGWMDGEPQAFEASEGRRLDRVPLDRATLPTPSKARPREKGLSIYVNTETKG